MALRLNPLTALEGSFRGFPFLVSRERKPGGQRGPLHEYPDRDEPYFEPLGRKAKQFDLSIYFVGIAGDPTGTTADLQADAFEQILIAGKPGPLVLGLRRENVWARSWERERSVEKSSWVSFQVTFVEAGRNQYPSSKTSWPHALTDIAEKASAAFQNALGQALNVIGQPLEVVGQLLGSAQTLVGVLNVAAQLVGGASPASALAAAGLLTGTFLGGLPGIGQVLSVLSFASSTVNLISGWADALAGDQPDTESRGRAIDALFTVYDEAASDVWYAPDALTPTQSVEIANHSAYSAAIRRVSLSEAARLAAVQTFASYDDAVALRQRFADAFDDEINRASTADGSREMLATLQATTLLAISDAGADKARLVPYKVPRPRTSIGLAQLFYPDDPDVASRAAELVARNSAIHPAFMPAEGERLSS